MRASQGSSFSPSSNLVPEEVGNMLLTQRSELSVTMHLVVLQNTRSSSSPAIWWPCSPHHPHLGVVTSCCPIGLVFHSHSRFTAQLFFLALGLMVHHCSGGCQSRLVLCLALSLSPAPHQSPVDAACPLPDPCRRQVEGSSAYSTAPLSLPPVD